MAEFPSICPVRRSYQAPQFPTKRFTSISGAGTTRLYGSKGFDARLDVQFVVDHENLGAIMDSWESSYGNYLPVSLPSPVLASSSNQSQSIVPDYLKWHWAQAPKVESVNPEFYRVTVNFIAHLEANS